MTHVSATTSWEGYCQAELRILRPLLAAHGFALEETQVHLGGERAVISGKKLVLLGTRLKDQQRVVIKASSHAEGQKEMREGHAARLLLDSLDFAYKAFLAPEELGWYEEQGCLISITAFIEQSQTFLERPFKEQFFLAMKAFETQESAHAATYEHVQMIRHGFRVHDTQTYIKLFTIYREKVCHDLSDKPAVNALFDQAQQLLESNQERIEQYNGFLTHTDFVPHNIRIVGRDIYLLDHYSILFGNKYEGWARFLNFMLLYHRDLEQALLKYVKDNRAAEEYEALQLMRIFRLGELIWYYVSRLEKTEGDLHKLDKARVFFWIDALESIVTNHPLSQERISAYQTLRDQLRSNEEKQRQQKLH